MTNPITHMANEVRSIPQLTQTLLSEKLNLAKECGDHLRALSPKVVTTIARGSSDHATVYLKYAIELALGIPVASMGPSTSSVYGASMTLDGAASIAISQSGASPDILSMAETAKKGGSFVLSLTNNSDSPLANISNQNFDIGAGKEQSVAATKTFVLSIVAGLMVIANWKQDQKLLGGIRALPEEFEKALGCDWSPLLDHIVQNKKQKNSIFVLGRGPSFGIARECALKFKETCQLHAEAYSAAEVLHGPVAIAKDGFTVLALASNDASKQSVIDSSVRIAEQGVDVFITAPSDNNIMTKLPSIKASHSLIDPLVQVVSFYNFIEQLSRKLGHNPDEPPHLRKVTQTI